MSALKKVLPSALADRYDVEKLLIRALPKKPQAAAYKGLRKREKARVLTPEPCLIAGCVPLLVSGFDDKQTKREWTGEEGTSQRKTMPQLNGQCSSLKAGNDDPGDLIATQDAGTIWPSVVDFLRRSEIFSEYQQAFCDTTGLPLALIDTTPRPFPFAGISTENPFCALMDHTELGYASSLEMQKVLSSTVGELPFTLKCVAGLSYTVIPVACGGKILGYLYTGQVFLREPTRKAFNRTVKLLVEWGIKADAKQIESGYFGTRILTPQQYDAMLRLLSVFANHLSVVSNRIVVEPAKLLSPMIEDAQHYIREHRKEPMTLTDVATSVNVSAQYFSSLFHEATGITFTDYVARVRVEHAKALLANSQNRISEVAFAVGFESLSQFNRVFRRVVGHSPTQSRADLSQSTTRD